MLRFDLRWSRWELCFLSACHLLAGMSALQADLLLLLRLLIVAAVLLSFLAYLRDRLRIFASPGVGRWPPARTQLLIGAHSTRLICSDRSVELQLPSVSYSSEFLLVLCFRPEVGGGATLRLPLWPDSLSRRQACRLRRYLRFDLAEQLGA